MVAVASKLCRGCSLVKPAADYHLSRTKSTGLQARCKACCWKSDRGLSLEERFWKRVTKGKPDECWLWTGYRCHGYGNIGHRGARVAAHRLSWKLYFNEEPHPDLFVCHRCDNPRCVNPRHLFLGTAADNNADRCAKGRNGDISGERNKGAKLSSADVVRIRAMLQSGHPSSWISQDFGVSATAIRSIKSRRTWRHL